MTPLKASDERHDFCRSRSDKRKSTRFPNASESGWIFEVNRSAAGVAAAVYRMMVASRSGPTLKMEMGVPSSRSK